jgi:hypothetical protein
MRTTIDRSSSPAGAQVTTVSLDGKARVIVLRGAIGGESAEQLRNELLSAIAADVRELVLDLSDVESISSPIRDLVAAAGNTLAGRGGVLLAWSERHAGDEQAYVISELRDRASAFGRPRIEGGPALPAGEAARP